MDGRNGIFTELIMKKKQITLYIKTDVFTEMAWVHFRKRKDLDLPNGMMGNYWDFHPGCHGITEYGDFRSYLGLAMAMQDELESLGYTVITKSQEWDYKKWAGYG